jgi:hypothetical protein
MSFTGRGAGVCPRFPARPQRLWEDLHPFSGNPPVAGFNANEQRDRGANEIKDLEFENEVFTFSSTPWLLSLLRSFALKSQGAFFTASPGNPLP